MVTNINDSTKYGDLIYEGYEIKIYKNANDLSEKILKVASDEKLRKKVGENGKKKYMKLLKVVLKILLKNHYHIMILFKNI